MTISERTKAVLLLNCFFNSTDYKSVKPLTPNEYGYLARWLNHYKFEPVQLLDDAFLNEAISNWNVPKSHIEPKRQSNLQRLDTTIASITYERLSALLKRGASLSFALEKWSKAGIWVIDRSSPFYPKKIKSALKDQCPAVFFGVGKPELLQERYIGFVGARDSDIKDEQATNSYVSSISELGYGVVSGAAKGVDSFSMHAGIKLGKPTLGIVSDSLYQKSASREWRAAIQQGLLTLISPFFPEARFTPANAMARNKFIYLMSEGSIVVRSNTKGGTWDGAVENIKKGFAPLLVSEHVTPNYEGNKQLLTSEVKNAVILPSKLTSEHQLADIEGLLQGKVVPASNDLEQSNFDLFNMSPVEEDISGNTNELVDSVEEESVQQHFEERLEQEISTFCDTSTESIEVEKTSENTSSTNASRESLVDLFCFQLIHNIEARKNKQITWDELQEEFDEFLLISKTALKKWLDVLIEDGRIIQLSKKKIYTVGEKNLTTKID